MQTERDEQAEADAEIDPGVRTLEAARGDRRARLRASSIEAKARLTVFAAGICAAAFLIWLYNVASAAAR